MIIVTPRQLEIAKRIAAGDRNKEIARAFGVALKTIEKHRSNLYTTIGARNAADVTRYVCANALGVADVHKP